MSKVYIELEDIEKHVKEIKPLFNPGSRPALDAFVQSLKINVPKVESDAPMQKIAKWIPASTKPGVHAGMKCSECKARISYSEHFNGQHLYCHKCGAKMTKNEDLVNTFRTYAGVPGYEEFELGTVRESTEEEDDT